MEEKIKPEHQENRRFSTRQIILLLVVVALLSLAVGTAIAYQQSNNPDTTSMVADETIDPESCSLPPTPTPSSGTGIGDFMLQGTPVFGEPEENCGFTAPSD